MDNRSGAAPSGGGRDVTRPSLDRSSAVTLHICTNSAFADATIILRGPKRGVLPRRQGKWLSPIRSCDRSRPPQSGPRRRASSSCWRARSPLMTIEVRKLSKRFGSFAAAADVSFVAPEGKITSLLGPSGSGKSTILRLISGLEPPDSGTVSIAGKDVTAQRAQDRGVGFVFQNYALFRHMTVADNIAFGLVVRKAPKAESRARVDELLKLVQLSGFENRYPAQLSGGQRQR